MRLAAISLVLTLAGGCSGPVVLDGVPAQELLDDELLQGAQKALDAGRYEAAAEYSEAVIERPDSPDWTPRALYLAGMARLGLEQQKKAFSHFKTLIHDYPISPFVPLTEDPLFEIGSYYLGLEPSPVFGDLFSGRERGVAVMREYATAFPWSDREDDATLAVANFYFGREDYDLAAFYYARVLEGPENSTLDDAIRSLGSLESDAPRWGSAPRAAAAGRVSEWADLAGYRLGLCYLKYGRGAGYDRTPLLRAATAFRNYLSRGETGEYRVEAEQGLTEAEEELAQSELIIAQTYFARNQPRGARIHLANTVLAYPRTQAAQQAREDLEEFDWDLTLNSVDLLDRTSASASQADSQ